MVKRIISCVVAVIMILLCLVSAASCSRPPEYDEIKDRFVELVEASYEINKVLF